MNITIFCMPSEFLQLIVDTQEKLGLAILVRPNVGVKGFAPISGEELREHSSTHPNQLPIFAVSKSSIANILLSEGSTEAALLDANKGLINFRFGRQHPNVIEASKITGDNNDDTDAISKTIQKSLKQIARKGVVWTDKNGPQGKPLANIYWTDAARREDRKWLDIVGGNEKIDPHVWLAPAQ